MPATIRDVLSELDASSIDEREEGDKFERVFWAHRAALQGGFKVGDVVVGHGDQGAAGVEVRGAQGVLSRRRAT